ncbi:unnamed protein product [Clonostachys rosea f. rosea IK726]|uniref:Uncharacterized protein n=1 Tax=Clonostachys rosea f. rosea IK726 TaxID=1349383 RepID=A0ACA9U149_BIOOC|nr:unnamed protein product [Clonostachys rosea f. rosea IK726]
MAASKPQSKDDQVTEYIAVGKFSKNVVAACDAVAALFPAQVVRAASSAYIEAQNSYWNASQRQKEPACFFQPTSAEQVSAAIVEVVRADCAFAIKGGGHSSNPDGSSIQDGFQFDLSKLNHIEISETDRTLRVGPGVHWGSLLKILESRGLSAVGGRDAGVGVPGFGIDNLISFDIVLANGDLLTVDRDSHPDLNKTLHGGGAFNFGIVTSLTLKLHSYDGMWGGMNVVDEANFDAVWDAYDKYTSDLIEENKAHLIMDFFQLDGRMVVAKFMGFLAPQPNPAIFQGLCSIPKVHDTLRLDQYSGLAKEMQEVTNCRGERNTYWTLAMRYDIRLLKDCYELWARMTKAYEDRFRFAFDVNHITPAMRNQAAGRGTGNV